MNPTVEQTGVVEIADLAFGGEGVARLPDGCVLFVPFTLPGEQVRVEVVSRHKRFARGQLLELLRPAPERVPPPCPLFGRCGGCQYQHLEYGAQVRAKAAQLQATLRRVGGFTALPEPLPVQPCPLPYGYRNKLCLEAVRTPQGLAYGFYALDNTTLLPVAACPLAMPALNATLAESLASPEAARNAALRTPQPLVLRQPLHGPARWFFDAATVAGESVEEEVLGTPARVPLAGFWQVNPAVAQRLFGTVREWYAAAPLPRLVDAYAGAGTFALALGAACATRVVIEENADAVAAARQNLRTAGLLEGARLVAGRAEAVLPVVLAEATPAVRRETAVLLDPPRGGCRPELLAALGRWPVRRLFYVSCDAATLSRDLRQLAAAGYRLERLALFDMFPQTAHFETAAALAGPEAAGA